jgi:hypothetical protein
LNAECVEFCVRLRGFGFERVGRVLQFTLPLRDLRLVAHAAIAQPLPEGIEAVELSLKLPVLEAQQTFTLRARVRSMTPDPRPDMPATLVGLQFEDLPQAARMTIGLFVAELLLAEADDVFGAIR